MGDVDDESLWARAHDSPTAFGELYERHADSVYNHCFRRTGSWSIAQDLTSTVFLDAWRRRREVRLVGDSILPWLLAVANNAIRNSARSRRRYLRLLERLPAEDKVADHSEDAVARIDSERRMQRVLVAFGHLTAAEQDVLSLCGWAGLSYEDAAAALGIPVGTVRSRLSRSREKLGHLSSSGASIADAETSETIRHTELGVDHV